MMGNGVRITLPTSSLTARPSSAGMDARTGGVFPGLWIAITDLWFVKLLRSLAVNPKAGN